MEVETLNNTNKIWVSTNPRGAERLPPGIIAKESDLYLRRLCCSSNEDVLIKHKYLVTFTVGYGQKMNIDAAVKKFSENFTILLFHYDGRASEWNEFEWSKRAIHVSVEKQTKWWYAKRFLHPDIVAPYDYIFIWDEDLGVQHFDAEEYIKLVMKHGLEISQPGLDPKGKRSITWQMTRRRGGGKEVHKYSSLYMISIILKNFKKIIIFSNWRCLNQSRQTKEKIGRCSNPLAPPCAGFVEIMAPVFSREAWRCVWHLIQNDLIHGWGLDFSFRMCAQVSCLPIFIIFFKSEDPLLENKSLLS
ncbi:uncharacterized protein LOC124930273 [Impatiens glandulifera]|uniref:uncharacterized protein LOC124930273 n=1 Tax=Impatiens glandulifera TaxID=253017 RepID=UPI001FB0AFC3|nr:uncharacterized protein LOC124930273 [Impatiens glandulifera]